MGGAHARRVKIATPRFIARPSAAASPRRAKARLPCGRSGLRRQRAEAGNENAPARANRRVAARRQQVGIQLVARLQPQQRVPVLPASSSRPLAPARRPGCSAHRHARIDLHCHGAAARGLPRGTDVARAPCPYSPVGGVARCSRSSARSRATAARQVALVPGGDGAIQCVRRPTLRRKRERGRGPNKCFSSEVSMLVAPPAAQRLAAMDPCAAGQDAYATRAGSIVSLR